MNATALATSWGREIESVRPQFESIAKTDGNLVTYQREASFAMQSFEKSEYLQKCSAPSIRNAVANVASVGLTLNPAMKLAYLVPRGGLCCLDISYIGLVKIATDSGGVLAVSAIPVRANDQFAYNGPFTMPEHKFDPFAGAAARGDIVGVYVVAKLTSGITQIDTLSREEINKIRDVSKAKSGPWVEWFEEMVKKSGIKRASKMWPRTERMAAAEAILNEHEGFEFTTIDHSTGEIVNKPKELPAYTDEQLDANFDAWQAAINSGKTTPQRILAMVSTKFRLSDSQAETIRGMKNEEAVDEFVAAMEAAEGAQS